MRRTILRLVGNLYRHDRSAIAVTGGDPLCRVLDTMLDWEQAEVAAAVRPCADTTAEEIADRSDKNPARARELLQELYHTRGNSVSAPAPLPGASGAAAFERQRHGGGQ